ncbi:14 kDa phosphohistidine phosphatase-like [Diprion similis]|uniref:14 kDa phosphohistidine phosphatase-like n=1 Tax=Diprion similis TaxID=362088 RepID=UPI001EF774AE|nr:14 kDa phosphohistidine phosphatase-like [Diprion similis]
MSELLDAIPDVDIDDNGKFKYILIHVFDAEKDTVKTIVRGHLREYHAHIYEEVEEKILKETAPRLETECIGGGFIEHKPADKKIKVYGRSMGFGKADHDVAVELLKKAYPDYEVITTNEE